MAGKPRRKSPQQSLGLADAIGAPPHFHGHRQRLRERLIAAGAENLPNYELMEVLLFAGNPRGDVKPLAKDLIERFGGFAEALSAGPDELLAVPGLGVAGTAALKSVREAALRLMKAELRDRPVIGSWDRLIDYCRAHIAYGKVEEFPVFGRRWDQSSGRSRWLRIRAMIVRACFFGDFGNRCRQRHLRIWRGRRDGARTTGFLLGADMFYCGDPDSFGHT